MAEIIKIQPEDSGQRLDRWLKRHFKGSIPYTLLQKLIRTGQIRLNGKRIKTDTILEEGQELRLPPLAPSEKPIKTPPKIRASDLEAFQESILYEDNDVLVLNKPIGWAVQGGTNLKFHLDQILQNHPTYGRLFLTHRLDRETSGVLILAKSREAAAFITQAFKEKIIEKTYWALIVGEPPLDEGEIHEPLEKKTPRGTMTVDAETHYRVLGAKRGITWVELMPLTGRTHQLRQHMAMIGCPILGDGLYGGREAHPFGKRSAFHLHARQISFTGPTAKQIQVQAPLPEELLKTFRELGLKIL